MQRILEQFDAADLPMHFQVESSRKLLSEAEAGRWGAAKQQVIEELLRGKAAA